MLDKKISLFLFTLLLLLVKVNAETVFEESLEEFKLFLYGIIAAVAAIFLVIQAIRLKIATSPEERKEAKKGIKFVFLGLILVMVAVVFVELIYNISEIENVAFYNATLILSANSWKTTGLTPSENQTGFQFEIKNEFNITLTNLYITVSSLEYRSCLDDIIKFEFPKIENFPVGATETLSFDNFCDESEKFLIQLKSDQNWWNYCAICPKEGGSCEISNGIC